VLLHAYRVGFTEAFTTILLIASAVALAGAVLSFWLIRSSDFVASYEAAPETETAVAA
jgi:FlaG/FlaF family flagellin (archaellin)